jgi:Recombination endonuclease VII
MARGLCRSHYGRARREGQLPPKMPRHSVSNVDAEARLADCAICGPQVPIRVETRKGTSGIRCRTPDKEAKRQAKAEGRSKSNSRPYTPELGWGKRLRDKYKISPADYERMAAEQAGRCAICRKVPERLFVDHDHQTGRVRGLLCRDCNFALGWLRDDADTAIAAAGYLKPA